MVSFKTILVVYVVGGFTLVPLLVVCLLAVIWYSSPELATDGGDKDGSKGAGAKAELDEVTASTKQKHKTSTKVYRCGWVTVRRTFEPVVDTTSDAGYMTMMASSYRSFVDSRSKDPRRSRPRDKYYAVLKDTVLFLYEDEQENDCFAAIKLPLHEVAIFPECLIDGELFMKRNAIRLKPILSAGVKGQEEVPSLILRPPPATNNNSNGTAPSVSDALDPGGYLPWYIFPSINHDKEDWYHSFVAGSRLPEAEVVAKDASLFDSNDMGNLVEDIDNQPDPIPTRWMNAMIGRLFFSVYKTAAVENYIVRKLMRKLSKVNKPDFLGDIEVKEVDVGKTTPFFSKPMLKELTADGDASMEVHVKYAGEFRIAIATTATLNLGQRFKSYSVKLVLAVILKDLEGTVLFKVKRPPSNRLWFGFTTPPKLGLRIEPVVSTRQIKWSLVTKPIESRLRELITESIVLPHMDDIAFFDTMSYPQRGGIYGECARVVTDLSGDGEAMEAAIDTEEGHLLPGVPNPKLSDPKEGASDNLRQRPSRGRKSSGAESVLSTKTMPADLSGNAGGRMSHTDLRPSPTSISLDLLNGTKPKSKDHSRSTSWFTGSGKSKSKDGATEPSQTQHTSTSTVDTNVQSSSSTDSLQSTPSTNLDQQSILSDQQKASDNLRNILKSKSTSALRSDPAVPPSTTKLDIAPDAALTSSPGPVIYKTSSGSSASTETGSMLRQSSHSDPEASGQSEQISDDTTSLFRRKSNKSTTSARSTASSADGQGEPADGASIMSASGSAMTTSSTSSSNIAILQNWKTKATDKQAIQASVNQARDAMSKWGTKWQAYRKSQQTGGSQTSTSDGMSMEFNFDAGAAGSEDNQSRIGPATGLFTDSSLGRTEMPLKSTSPLRPSPLETSTTGHRTPPDSRSRSSSLISTSPTGHFKPSAAITTTSLSIPETPETLMLSAGPSLESASTSQPAIRRVPPPPSMPPHPALARDVGDLPAAPPKRNSYKPAPMMSIPGIQDSRRFHASSSDVTMATAAQAQAPPLPSRGAVSPTHSMKRKPPPEAFPSTETASDQSSQAIERSSYRTGTESTPPPLPIRPQNSGDSRSSLPDDSLDFIGKDSSSLNTIDDQQASANKRQAPEAEKEVPQAVESVKLLIQPPTPVVDDAGERVQPSKSTPTSKSMLPENDAKKITSADMESVYASSTLY